MGCAVLVQLQLSDGWLSSFDTNNLSVSVSPVLLPQRIVCLELHDLAGRDPR